MSKFVLTAQLQLQAPTNTAQIVNLVNKQLQGVQMNVNPVVNAKSLNQANQAIQNVGVSAKVTSKNLNTAAGSAGNLGTALGAAARRFASITLATGFFLALTRAVGSAVGRAVEFEKEMLKISQVTGKSVRGLRDLSSEVTRLSTTLGVSSEELLNVARTLSQAGFAADKVTGALKILAQTDLAATFDNIKDTTEGAVAILSQFRSEVRAAGGEVQFLEKAMDSINSVSKSFAVESSDLISVVRRTGGVFEAAGGKLNELIALFTSVRATTRETADTIATGFRTIFTRIQRSETIDSLKELGIVLQDTEGKFVGPMEAVARLSAGLSALDPRDFRFNEIVEQLGGFRQIGKVIPLIKQYSTSTAALAVANNSLGSTARDAGIAQQGLGNQFAQLKEKFDATVRSLASSETFQTLATTAIKLAESILKVVDSLEPLLPMLTALAAFKMGQIALPAFGKFAGVGKHEGGKIQGFAGGGMVPGRGNRDTVPAALTPGEFVMRKSAVKKIGANNMADMNNGYAAGGTVTARRSNYGMKDVLTPKDKELIAARKLKEGGGAASAGPRKLTFSPTPGAFGAVATTPPNKNQPYAHGGGYMAKGKGINFGSLPAAEQSKIIKKYGMDAQAVKNMKGKRIPLEVGAGIYNTATPNHPRMDSGKIGEAVNAASKQALQDGIADAVQRLRSGKYLDLPPGLSTDESMISKAQSASAKDNQAVTSLDGFLFEGVVGALTGAIASGKDAAFDLGRGAVSASKSKISEMFGEDVARSSMIEVKRSLGKASTPEGLPKKLGRVIEANPSDLLGKGDVRMTNFAKGGKPTGTDTVPAMLTPGEFVMKKSAAQDVGYSNLHRMNQSNGVNGYAAGGIVGSTRNNYGTMPGGAGGAGGAGINMGPVNSSMIGLAESATKVSLQLETLKVTFTSAVDDFLPLQSAIANAATGISAIDDAVRAPLSQGATVLAGTLSEVGNSFISLPATILNLIDDGAVQFGVAMKNAATGMSTIDDTLKQSLVASATPLKASIGVLDAEFKKFGTELKTKLVYFDVLKKANTDLLAVMEKLGVLLLEKGDDFNILKPAISALESSLLGLTVRFWESADDLLPLKGGVSALTAAMQSQSKQMMGGKSGGMATLGGPTKMLASGMNNANKAILAIPGFVRQLNAAMLKMVTALNAASVGVTTIGSTAAPTSAELKRLQAENTKLILAFTRLQDGANKAATKLKSTTAPVGGGAAKGGGGGGGGQMMNQMMMMGMVATQYMDLDKKTEAVVNTFSMLGTILAMVALELGPMAGAAIANATATSAETVAKLKGITVQEAQTLATKRSAMIQGQATGVAIGLALAITIVTSIMTWLGEEAKELGEEYNKAMKDLRSGQGGLSLGQSKDLASKALAKEAQASGATLGYWAAAAAAIIATVVLAFVTFGASLVVQAAITVAAIAAAGASGAAFGATIATVADAIEGAGGLLVDATYHASVGISQLALANKAMELEQLKGVELMQRQGQAFDDLAKSSGLAILGMAGFQGVEAGMDQDIRADMEESDIFGDIKDGGIEAMKELSKTWYKMAQDMASGMNGAVDEMIEGGMSAKDAMASADIQDQLKKYGQAVEQATRIQMMMSGLQNIQAKKEMGYNGILDENLTRAQRIAVQEREQQIINKEVAETSKKAQDAQEKSMNARLEADAKAKKAADEKLASDIALAQQAYRAARALSEFEVAMVGMQGAINTVDMEFGALTGSIKAYKSNNDALISTLSSGNVSPEAEQAAMTTASQFGLEGETAALIEKMKENENIRTVLTEKGMKAFSGKLEESAANLRFDKFMKDNGIDLSGLDANIRKEIMNKLKDGLQPGEIEEIMDSINGANEEQIKVLAELAKAQNAYVGALFKFGGEIVKLNEQYAAAIGNVINVQLRGAERLAKAQGRDLTTGEVKGAEEARRRAPLQAMGMQGGGVRSTQIQLDRRREKSKELADRLRNETGSGGGQDPKVIADVQNQQIKLGSETKALTANLKKLSDQSKLAASIMGDIEKEKGKRDTVRGLISEFTFASNSGRKDMDRNFMALQRVMQTGNLNSIPDEMRGAVGGLLDTLEDIDLGGGMTGGDVKKQLEMQMANQLKIRATGKPLTAEEMQKIFNKTTKEEQLINDLKALNAEEVAAAQALADNEANKIDDLLAGIERLIKVLEAAQTDAGAAAGEVLTTASQGGVIYAAGGQSIFKPKGTDTVPAMLTPGEFVVNSKSAKQHAGTLQAINSGSTKYLAGGGPVTSRLGYKGDYNEQAQHVRDDVAVIKTGVNGAAVNAVTKIKDKPFKDFGLTYKQVMLNDMDWSPNGQWDGLKMDGDLLSLSDGMLKRKGYNNDAKKALIAWMNTANLGYAPTEVTARDLATLGVRPHSARDMLGAHRFFSDKTFPRAGGTIGDNENSLAFDYWDSGWPSTPSAEDIREMYESGVEPSLHFGRGAASDTFDSLSRAYSQYKSVGSNIRTSHPKEMYAGVGPNGGFPASPSNAGAMSLPNPQLLMSMFKDPGANQFSWLSSPKFTEQKDASDMFYSALVGAEGYPSIKEPKDRLNKNGPLAFGSATSSYGKYLHDTLFNNNNFKSKLEKFYKDPDSATADDVKGILGDIDLASIHSFMRSTAGDDAQLAIDSLMSGGTWGARSLLSGWGMSTGLTQGPSGDKAEGIALEGLGYVPWDADNTIFSPDLKKILTDSQWQQEYSTGIATAGGATNEIDNSFMGEFKNHKKQSSIFLAGELTRLLDAIEGPGATGDLGTGLLTSVEKIVAGEEADAAADADALAVGIANDVVPNLDVFYATKANKKQAMLTSLGEYPGLNGAPYKVGRIPDYAKALKTRPGVKDPRTGKEKKAPIQKVTDVKRDSDSFDALFPYFKMLADDVMGIVSVGGITGATPDGGIQFDAQKIAGGVGEKTMEALRKWSSVPYENWYEGGIPDREAERMIGLFWNFKKVDTALRKMQGSTRDAMVMAKGLKPDLFNDMFAFTGLPDWLGGNDAPDRVDPMDGFATGGHVGSSGNPKAKGTDTVPAMLTPGEFVMKKSAVDKYGTGFMRNINQGAHFSQGGEVSYFDEGGLVGDEADVFSAIARILDGSVKEKFDEWVDNAAQRPRRKGRSLSDATTPFANEGGEFAEEGFGERLLRSMWVGSETERGRRIDKEVETQRLLELKQKADKLAAKQEAELKISAQRAKKRDVSPWVGAMASHAESKNWPQEKRDEIHEGMDDWTGFTDSEWVKKVAAWQQIQREAREFEVKKKKREEEERLAETKAAAEAKIKSLERGGGPFRNNEGGYKLTDDTKASIRAGTYYLETPLKDLTPEERAKRDKQSQAEDAKRFAEHKLKQEQKAEQIRVLKERAAEGNVDAIAQVKEIEEGPGPSVEQQERDAWKARTLTPAQQEEKEQAAHKAGQAAQTIGTDQGGKVNIGDWLDEKQSTDRGGEGDRNNRSNAAGLLGEGINQRVMFDLSHLINPASASADLGALFLQRIGIEGGLESDGGSPFKGSGSPDNKSVKTIPSGYAATHVNIGEPYPTDRLDRGVTIDMFKGIFGGGGGGLDQFYPSFKGIPNDAAGVSGNVGELVELVTLSRGMRANAPQRMPKFDASVTELYKRVRNTPISNTLMGGKFSKDKNGMILDGSGNPTNVRFNESKGYDWRTSGLLSPQMAALASEVDSVQGLLDPQMQNWYRGMQATAQKEAKIWGRQILVGKIDGANEQFNPAQPGGALGFASGGSVFTPRGTDTVPAMLTPGEFVMKKSAVDKYGTGFMRDINNGVQRFAKGGPVQYLKNGSHDPVAAQGGGGGGGFGDIVSSISDSLSAFTQAFTLFSGLSTMLSNTISSLADMNINHTISINGSLNIPGFSTRAIKKIVNNIAEELIESTDEKIKQAFKQRDSDNENKT